MYRLINSAALRVRLYTMRRRQRDSLALRRFFADNYNVVVGLYSYGCFDRWRMPGPMIVGRYCSIASTVRSVLRNHPIRSLTTHPVLYERAFGVVDRDLSDGPPLVISDDVWIGHNALILPGCKAIGRGAIIGAGAVVTKDVPPYTVVGGNPAKRIYDRFPPSLVEAIEASRWWEMTIEDLARVWRERPEVLLEPTDDALADLAASAKH